MPTYSFASPILEGKTDAFINYVQEVKGPRHDQYLDYMRKTGLEVEQVWLQRMPDGDFIVVSWETNDPQKVIRYGLTSDDPFAKWFRDHILVECLGIDPSQPPPQNEQIVDFHLQRKGEKQYQESRKR